MNYDDPKLTAFALDELDARTRAEMEEQLATDALAAAAVASIRSVAREVRGRLRKEMGPGLDQARRAELLRLAGAAPAERIVEFPARIADSPVGKVMAFPARLTVWTAVAASVAVGVSWALVLPALKTMNQERTAAKAITAPVRDGSDVRVALVPEPSEEAAPLPTPQPRGSVFSLSVRPPESGFHFTDRFVVDRDLGPWERSRILIQQPPVSPAGEPVWLHDRELKPAPIDLARPRIPKK